MQLVYNGGLCGPLQLQGSEVEAMWPTVLRPDTWALSFAFGGTCRTCCGCGASCVAAWPRGAVGRRRRGRMSGRPGSEAFAHGTQELDMEKSHLQGLEEFSVLLEL